MCQYRPSLWTEGGNHERPDGGQQQRRDRRLRPQPGRAPFRPGLGSLAVDTARKAIADAGLETVDGFVTGALFPTAGSHTAEDGVSLVSANWLAEHLGVNPRYAAGFQGFGQIPGSVAMAVNAVASGAADYVLLHRALHNPKGQYHLNTMRDAAVASNGRCHRATSGLWP